MSVIQENVSLLSLNTFHLDIRARYLVDLENVKQTTDFLTSGQSNLGPKFILGGGSNVLFVTDFKGIIIRPLMKGIETIGENEDFVWLRAGACENWDSFVAWCVARDLGGIENLSLIPGSVGASPIQNIGAYGVEIKDSVHLVEAVNMSTGEPVILHGKDCRFGYRDSIFKHELRGKVIITHVVFKLNKKHNLSIGYADLEKEMKGHSGATIQTVREAVISIRRNKLPDPDDIGNAGSFFKNPVLPAGSIKNLEKKYPGMPVYPVNREYIKLSAAWLIDKCGWKGKKAGNTGTYEKQALILINRGGATGREILKLAREIQESVRGQFGLNLEMEVNVVGE